MCCGSTPRWNAPAAHPPPCAPWRWPQAQPEALHPRLLRLLGSLSTSQARRTRLRQLLPRLWVTGHTKCRAVPLCRVLALEVGSLSPPFGGHSTFSNKLSLKLDILYCVKRFTRGRWGVVKFGQLH